MFHLSPLFTTIKFMVETLPQNFHFANSILRILNNKVECHFVVSQNETLHVLKYSIYLAPLVHQHLSWYYFSWIFYIDCETSQEEYFIHFKKSDSINSTNVVDGARRHIIDKHCCRILVTFQIIYRFIPLLKQNILKLF